MKLAHVGIGIGLIGAMGVWSGTSQAGPCHGEFCDPDPPPPPCAEVNTGFSEDGCPADFQSSEMEFRFEDAVPAGASYPNQDTNDGQLWVRGDQPSSFTDCGIVLVKQTDYYAIYDSELSESCGDQLDETGYLTVHNSCNGDGWATSRNVGERYLVIDRDNQGAGCTDDNACDANYVCREGTNHGNCCVPSDPVYVGTFLLVAGEENVICIHHWCPEWKDYIGASSGYNGTDYGFVHDVDDLSNNCTSPDSIHFKIAATAIVCRQEGYIQACAGGCENGQCLPHPCFAAECDQFCVMNDSGAAECVDDNPCGGIACPNGCMFGLCLQDQSARGDDDDDDGYTHLADCDDHNANVNPGKTEVCDNGIDDDCNGFTDDCGTGAGGNPLVDSGPSTGPDGGTLPGGSATSEDSGGCGCRASRSGGAALLWGVLAFAVIAIRRVRERRRISRLARSRVSRDRC